jgi:hypothetical protein
MAARLLLAALRHFAATVYRPRPLAQASVCECRAETCYLSRFIETFPARAQHAVQDE